MLALLETLGGAKPSEARSYRLEPSSKTVQLGRSTLHVGGLTVTDQRQFDGDRRRQSGVEFADHVDRAVEVGGGGDKGGDRRLAVGE